MSDHYIEFRNVYKTFDYPVLVDVNFYVDAGQTLEQATEGVAAEAGEH